MATMKDNLKAFQIKMKSLCQEELTTDDNLIKYYSLNNSDNNELRKLYKFYFNQDFGGCGNCIVDATAKILGIDLNSELANKKEISFQLYAGALLQDVVNFDSSKSVSNYNLTEDNAWWHLNQSPSKLSEFVTLPENFDELANPKLNEIKAKASINEINLECSYSDGKILVREKGFYAREKGEENFAKYICEKDFSLKLDKEIKADTTYEVMAYCYNDYKEVTTDITEITTTSTEEKKANNKK